MDQMKIGQFIADRRKAAGLTQRQLADKLLISDKTVSKWERGGGLPDVSLMLPLCEELGVSVNELLAGEVLADQDYKRKAEENIMDLMKEKQESKRKIILAVVVVMLTMLAGITLILLTEYLPMSGKLQAMLLVIGLTVILGGIAVAAALEMKAGTYECRHCGRRFVPTAGAYVAGPHSLTTRWLTCPHCGKKSFCKRRLTH